MLQTSFNEATLTNDTHHFLLGLSTGVTGSSNVALPNSVSIKRASELVTTPISIEEASNIAAISTQNEGVSSSVVTSCSDVIPTSVSE